MKTDRHRTALACVVGGQPRWWVLSLEMLFTCTCYSQLHWRWFGYVSPYYCTTWPSLVLTRFRFLLDHMSGPCCSTCKFSIGTCIVLRLGLVSLLHWTKCRILYWSTWRDHNTPRVFLLLDHVSRCCTSMCQYFIRPCVTPWATHVSFSDLTTWQDRFVPRI